MNLKTRLIISSEVVLDEKIKKRIENEYGRSMTNVEAAECLLFAYINPKLTSLNDDGINGTWDTICDFRGRINNIQIEEF